MAHIQKIVGGGATFEDLLQFVEECKEKKIPRNTPVKISQYDVVGMQADDESINFYDWI